MASKVSRKRKRVLCRLAEGMRQKKALQSIRESSASESTVTLAGFQQPAPSSGATTTSAYNNEGSANNLDESFQLPGPLSGTASKYSSEEDSDDADYTDGLFNEGTKHCYDDWLLTLQRENTQMMAMMIYHNYRERFGLLKTAAAKEVSLLLGVNEKTIRMWRAEFLSSKGCFNDSTKGKYSRYVVIDDEEYKGIALKWIRENATVKGKPNLIATDFCEWVNITLLLRVVNHHLKASTMISATTATRWLHKLGFSPSSTKKGVYIDGHERQDVDYRKLFLTKMNILETTHAQPPQPSDKAQAFTESDSGKKNLILIYHDESIFHSNDDHGWAWAEK